jgi:hypothetical protein
MKIQEFINLTDAISQPLGRDEYIDSKVSYFNNANIVYTINNLNLKKYISTDQEELYYGLFDKSKLVAILQLESIKQGWQVRLTQVQEPYKSQGYGSFMYDYAVMNDGLTLLSDTSQTEGQLGGSKGLWEKLYRQGRFTVGGYNLETDEFITLSNSSDISDKIYNQKEDIVWIAMPKNHAETISEMQSRLQKQNKHRSFEWYGSEINDQ